MTAEIIIKILEIIGTVAFSVSGALVAIKAGFDIFGVIVVGAVTAVGGGITRDVLIGRTPPAVFEHTYILAISCAVSVIVFLISYIYHNKFQILDEKIEKINNYFDAAGLAAFSVMGVEIALGRGLQSNVVLSVILGVLTGVGGGLLRDIFTENLPYIFKKHIYAIASIAGGVVYYMLRLYTQSMILPTLLGMLIIMVLRIFATVYRWNLPKVHISSQSSERSAHQEESNVENSDAHSIK